MVSPEDELAELEEEARRALGQRIPVRRFGQPVQLTRERQRQIISLKQRAIEQIRKIREARQQLSARTEQDDFETRRLNAIEKALRKGGFALGAPELTKEDRKLISKILRGEKEAELAYEQRREQIKELRQKGLTTEQINQLVLGKIPEGLGGQTLISGEQVLVTPSGEIIQSLQPIPPVGGIAPVGATAAEIALQQSLPQGIRELSPADASFVLREGLIPVQTLQKGGIGFVSRIQDANNLLEPEDFEEKKDRGFFERTFEEAKGFTTRQRLFKQFIGIEDIAPTRIGAGELIFSAASVAGQDIKTFLKSKEAQALARSGLIGFGLVSTNLLGLRQDSELERINGEIRAFSLRVAAEVIPTTPEEVAITVGTTVLLGAASRPLQKLLFGGIGGFETTTAFIQPDLTIEQRTAKGIIGITSLGTGALIKTRFQLGEAIQRQQINLLQKEGQISKETAIALKAGVRAEKFARSSPDVPLTKKFVELIAERTPKEQEIIMGVIAREKDIIFGSTTTRARGLRNIEERFDIDKFSKENQQLIKQFVTEALEKGLIPIRRGGAVSIRGSEKALDIQSLERRMGFILREKPLKFGETQITKLSEQASRALSGTTELRKGGKDIGEAILGFRALVETSKFRLKKTRIPILKQIRQIKQRKFEKLISKLEKALPELTIKTLKVGESKIAREALELKPLIITTPFPLPVIKGKKGRLGGLIITEKELRTIRIVLPKKSKSELEIDKFIAIPSETKILRIKKIKGGLEPSEIKIFRLKPSRLIPSKLPSIKSSKLSSLKPSKLPSLKPSKLTSIIPSRFKDIVPSKLLIEPIIKISLSSKITPSKLKPSRIPTMDMSTLGIITDGRKRKFDMTNDIIRIQRKKRKKQLRSFERKFQEDLALVPDITSRAIEAKIKIPRIKLREAALKRVTEFSLRKIPVIIK